MRSAIINYIRSDRFLCFSSGWSYAAFLAAVFSTLALGLRFVFGAHTLWQAGAESAVFGLALYAAFLIGYRPLFFGMFTTSAGFLPGFGQGVLVGKSPAKILLFSVLAGAAMMHFAPMVGMIVVGSFTSTFWTALYSIAVGIMLACGAGDWYGERRAEIIALHP